MEVKKAVGNKQEREQTTIRLPVDMKEEIQRRADKEGQSFNTEIILLLRKVLEAE